MVMTCACLRTRVTLCVQIMERILYVWAIRHPASGYVQGINDLVVPFFVVFLDEYADADELNTMDVSRLSQDVLDAIEADTFWCMTKLLDSIQVQFRWAHVAVVLTGDWCRISTPLLSLVCSA
jgi:TBC1 domain family member 2